MKKPFATQEAQRSTGYPVDIPGIACGWSKRCPMDIYWISCATWVKFNGIRNPLKMSKEPHISIRAAQLAPCRSTADCKVKGCLFYVRRDVAILQPLASTMSAVSWI